MLLLFYDTFVEAIGSSVDPPLTQIDRKYKTRDFKFVASSGNQVHTCITLLP